MKRVPTVFLFLIFCSSLSFGQFTERFEALNETNLKGYATPFATSFGLAMNSGGFYTADIPSFFGLSISLRGMYMLIPEDQKKFTPVLSGGYTTKEVSTIYGDKGGVFAGPNGYQVTPPGLDISAIPLAYPQVTVSFMGTEVLLRLLPKVKFSREHDVNLLGVGVRHNISQYIPLMPVDIAAQVLYNKLEISNLMESKNLAFNIHASKTFAIITPYVGLQYESSSMDIDYTYKPVPDDQTFDQRLKVSLDGDNSFRAVVGASLNLLFLVINADAGFSTQTVLSAGITLAF